MEFLKGFVQRARSGQAGSALLSVLYLLLTAGLVLVVMTVSACDCNENGIDDCDYEQEAEWAVQQQQLKLISKLSEQIVQTAPGVNAMITNSTGGGGRDVPGQRVQRLLGNEPGSGSPPAAVSYRWHPPQGASNFAFSGRQPEPGWDPANPVFVFAGVPPAEQIPAAFDLPDAAPYGGNQLPEALECVPDTGPPTMAYYVTALGASRGLPPPASAAGPAAVEQTVQVWRTQHWFTRAISVTTAECQQAVDLLQSDAPFLVMSLPEPAHAVTESALVPVYDRPRIELVDYGGGLDVQADGAVRVDRLAFAANALPATAGRIWVPLGVSTVPSVTCPAAAETSDWEVYTGLLLDLSFAPAQCEGCVLDTYLCYEGQALPGGALRRAVVGQMADRALEAVAEASGGTAGVQGYQDWGITCAGPLPFRLIDSDWTDWYMSGASAQWVTPTMPITLPFVLEQGQFDPPALVDLDYSSPALDAGWSWSDGTQDIVPPVSYSGGWPPTNVYLVGTVPAGTPPGLYTVYVTATMVSDPADFRTSSAFAWIGDWTPPPLAGTVRVYLPLVVRK